MPRKRQSSTSSKGGSFSPVKSLLSTKVNIRSEKASRRNVYATPVRNAKRTVRLLNEMEPTDCMVYTISDLKIRNLDKESYAINRVLNADLTDIDDKTLELLQHQLEDLIAENADNQKLLKGEISFLNTGEYPTNDLSERIMPIYTISERKSIPDDDITVDMLNSSPEQDTKQKVLIDVPNRFWTWTRRYLQRINVDYVKDFQTKIIDRFSEKNLSEYFIYESPKKSNKNTGSDSDFSNDRRPSISEQNQSKLAGASKKRRHSVIDGSPQECLPPVKMRLLASEFHENLCEKMSINESTTFSRRFSLRQEDEASRQSQQQQASSSADFSLDKTFFADEEVSSLDEVSLELKKKQKELYELSKQTYPLIEALYERVEAECAFTIFSNALDAIDDKLIFVLEKKYRDAKSFTDEQRKECKKALEKRYKALQRLYPYDFDDRKKKKNT